MSMFMDRLRFLREPQQEQWEVRWSTWRSLGLHNHGPAKHVEVFSSKAKAMEFAALLYDAAAVLKQQFWDSPTVEKKEAAE